METNGAEIRFERSGSLLRELREDAGFTIGALAKAIGCSVGTLSKIENGKLAVSFTRVLKMAKALKETPETIVLKIVERRDPGLRKRSGGKLVAELLERSAEDRR